MWADSMIVGLGWITRTLVVFATWRRELLAMLPCVVNILMLVLCHQIGCLPDLLRRFPRRALSARP